MMRSVSRDTPSEREAHALTSRCPRPHCGGVLVPDLDGPRCLSCGRAYPLTAAKAEFDYLTVEIRAAEAARLNHAALGDAAAKREAGRLAEKVRALTARRRFLRLSSTTRRRRAWCRHSPRPATPRQPRATANND
jgi:hypothetical protein